MQTFQLKSEHACSEVRLGELASELAASCRPGDVILLEGPMGAGKSTFTRAFLGALGVLQGGAGSPTFAIAHEYQSQKAGIVLHADFYRLKSEEEIDEAGVSAAIWERGLLCLLEWTSMFPQFEAQVLESAPGRVIRVNLAFGEAEDVRSLEIAGPAAP